MTKLTEGVGLGDAAVHRLDPRRAPADQEHGWTLAQAAEELSSWTARRQELIVAVAYLACQLNGVRAHSGEDVRLAQRLALQQIRSALDHVDEVIREPRQGDLSVGDLSIDHPCGPVDPVAR